MSDVGVLTRKIDREKRARHQAESLLERKSLEVYQAKERYRLLVETINDWIREVDADFVFTYVGPQVKDILGYEPDELLGKPVPYLMPPDEAERVGAFFREISQTTRKCSAFENVCIHKNGRPVYFETCGTPVFDEAGNLLGYRGVNRDVSTRKQADEALRNAHAELTQVFNAAPPMAVFGLDRTILQVNDACAEFVGKTKEQILGKNCSDVLAGSVCGTADCCLAKTRRGEPSEGEQVKYVGDGRQVPCIVKSYPYRDAQGEIVGCVQSITDISVLKEAENSLRASEKRHRTLFETSRDAIMTLAPPSWKFTSGNPATVEIFETKDYRHPCE